MLDITIHKGITPFLVKDETIVCAVGNELFNYSFDLKSRKRIGKYNAGIFNNILARTNFGSRIGRLGFHSVKEFRGGYIGIQKGKIVHKAKLSSVFENVFSNFRGSRPLNICIGPKDENIYFGEYFSNSKRSAVKIFHSANLKFWNIAYEFEASLIRHVHGIFYDQFRDGYWVLTGDSNKESGLWFTSDKFKTLDKIFSGSQKTRAVEMIIKEEGLIVPMDSPLELNSINFFSLKDNSIKFLQDLNGSAFHALVVKGIYFITTVTEISDINLDKSANVYASIDGYNWKCISKFKKDFVPIKYQWLTRYSEITIVPGESKGNYIFGHARAVRGGCFLFRWDKNNLLQLFKE